MKVRDKMGAKRFKKYDILAVIVQEAEKLGQTPNNLWRFKPPYSAINQLRPSGHVSRPTVLKFLGIYERERLLFRAIGRPLYITLHGNAWTMLRQMLKQNKNAFDPTNPVYPWLQERFGIQVSAPTPVAAALTQPGPQPAPVGSPAGKKPSALPVEEVAIRLPVNWRRIFAALGALLEILGEELQKLSSEQPV